MSKKILIVDDERGVVMLLKQRLEQAGYEIEEAFSGGEAQERMKTNHYDLVLLDYFLPDMLAVDLCKEIRSEQSGIGSYTLPIIIITGFSSRDEETFIAEGASAVIYKPIHADELADKVAGFLQLK